jgi:uncharacterized membrane protein YdbT with pleckstrin-like domain
LAGTLSLLIVAARFYSSEFAITNKRVIAKTGLIRRHSIEVYLDKIEAVEVSQGIAGRILGYGTIVVTGTGGTKDPIPMIPAPLLFKKKIQNEVHNTRVS